MIFLSSPMSPPEKLQFDMVEILNKLYHPIAFALRRRGEELNRIKGLERLVSNFAKGILQREVSPEVRELLQELMERFQGYEGLSPHYKRQVLERAHEILVEIDGIIRGADIKMWEVPLGQIRGIGPKTSRILQKRGFSTLGDLLFNLPLRYEDRRELKRFFRISPGEWVTALGQVLSVEEVQYPKSGRKVLEVLLGDGTGFIVAKWFQGWEYLKRTLKVGTKVIFSGEVKGYFEQKEVHHPDIEVLTDETERSIHFGRIVPVYSQTEGLRQRRIRSIMYRVIADYAPRMKSPIPFEVEARCGLVPFEEAIREVHFPSSSRHLRELQAGTSPYHRRMAFEELFLLEVALALKRQGIKKAQGIRLETQGVGILEEFLKRLPFPLTRAQRRALGEIKSDLCRPHPMYRLLQGDVGSGKTVVALCGALIAIGNGYQAAMMAPTEILAEQHFQTISELTGGLGVRFALLTSKIRGRERERILREVAEGGIQLLVGTHALIQEGIAFRDLAFVVVDEQHRFGVLQRARLYQKGRDPHLLVMTATPIPRTLAMTLYGDMEVSVLDEMPPGRGTVTTKIFEESERDEAYRILEEEVKKGRQGYVVYPLIEESEQMDLKNAKEGARWLQDRYPFWKVGLIHGRMPSEEKERTMRAFKAGQIQVLVSTTVVEVGIDVPNATVMIVEEAQRFGLAQLHQLRGRVG
ncbi:MAG: ATP-dependent DNA helicase RecG, partial [Deltaproteobacteria bacterium]